jgi:hypothetical protein
MIAYLPRMQTNLLLKNLQPLVQGVIHLDPPVHHASDDTSRRLVGNLGLKVELAVSAGNLLVPLQSGITGIVDKVTGGFLVVDRDLWCHQHEKNLRVRTGFVYKWIYSRGSVMPATLTSKIRSSKTLVYLP